MKLHHATAKRAEENGVAMEHNGDHWVATKGEAVWAFEQAPMALDAAIFDALIRAEYPALTLECLDTGFRVVAGEEHLWPLTNNGEAIFSKAPPKTTDLAEIVDTAAERGIDAEEGYDEDEDRKGGSVVDPAYKRQYAEDGHPNHNGDWLAFLLESLGIVTVEGKKRRTDVQTLNKLFADNGIISEDHKFGGAFHGTAPRSNGWEGRFRMSGGNRLRPIAAKRGYVIAFGEKHEAPADFIEKHLPAAERKARAKAEAEAAKEGGA